MPVCTFTVWWNGNDALISDWQRRRTLQLLKCSQHTRSWEVTGLGLLNTVCDVTLVSWLSEVPSGPTEYGVLVITLTKTCTIKSFSFAGRFRSPSRGTLLCLVTEQEDWCNTIGHGQDKQVMVRIVASSPVLRTPSVCWNTLIQKTS